MGIEVDGANQKLILDSDGDTYLEAATDDTIKVYIAGAHDATISANAINVLSGTTLTIDSGATITNSGTANGFSSADPSSADGDSLGTASAEWSDLYLADGGVIYFGNDQDITLTHVPDTGLILGGTTPKLTIGDAGAEDVMLAFDGNAFDFHIGLDDSADDLMFGVGTALGTTAAFGIDSGSKTTFVGAVQANNVITVGVDDTGHDVKFFGATSGAYMLWDESADDLNLVASGLGVGTLGTKDLGSGLHIKTSDIGGGASVHASADELVIENNGNGGLTILSASAGVSDGNIFFGDVNDNDVGKILYNHNDDHLEFWTNGSERMRIQSDGEISIGRTAATAYALSVELSNDTNYVATFNNTHATRPDLILWNYTAGTPDNTDHYFHYARDATTARWAVNNQGDVLNHDNSYGSISDERIKQDITDASSQWDDIKAVKVRKFRMKDDIRQYGEDEAKYNIGLVAQELETISPKLVEEGVPSAGDITSHSDFGTLYTEQDKTDGIIPEDKKVGDIKEVKENIKQIKYSILYMKAIKCLQEAQTRIETLEAKVAVLEG